MATFWTNTLNFTRVIDLNWLEKLNCAGPVPVLVKSNQSNLSSYSLYYAEECNELAGGPSPRHCVGATPLL